MKPIIRCVSFALAFVLVVGSVVISVSGTETPENKLEFTDVKNQSWYYDSVRYVFENKIMQGVSNNLFSPNGKLTRAMAVTILFRLSGEPDVNNDNTFIDVEKGQWYSKPVSWAQSEGVANGRTLEKFDPDGEILRAEFATMLYRYLYLSSSEMILPEVRDGEPVDIDSVPKYAKESVRKMYRSGIINGRENGEFDSSAKITRSETAAMVDRFLEKAKSITSDDGFGIRVDFDVPDAEEGFFRGGRISDVTVGYVPEGLNLYEVEDTGSEDIRTLRLSTAYDLESITQPFVMVGIYTSSEFKPGWGYKTYEHVYLGELNGMDACDYENSGESGGGDSILTARRAVTSGTLPAVRRAY